MLRVTAMSGIVLFAAFASRAAAQSAFAAALDGSQEVPPMTVPHSGIGSFVFDPFTKILKYEVTIDGVTGSLTSAAIENAPLGASGALVAPLSGAGPSFIGSIGPLGVADAGALVAGQLCVNVHSTAFPAGEIRGQIVPVRDQFAFVGSGLNESPPASSGATASGTLRLTATNQIVYDITYNGLTSAFTMAHIHNGPPGVNGPILYVLQSTSPGHVQGITPPLAPKGVPLLRSSLFYVNIHSTAFPVGEVRGQIVPSFLEYGDGCAAAGSGGVPAALSGDGIPSAGGSVTISIDGGVASSFGLLFVSAAAYDGSLGFGCPLLVHPAVLFPLALPLPGTGAIALPAALPATVPPGVAIDLQYIGDQGGGVPYATNGLQMSIVS